jgi:hypothetical protein
VLDAPLLEAVALAAVLLVALAVEDVLLPDVLADALVVPAELLLLLNSACSPDASLEELLDDPWW